MGKRSRKRSKRKKGKNNIPLNFLRNRTLTAVPVEAAILGAPPPATCVGIIQQGVIMPSVDHCLSKPTEMATITNSLEVFDTYKSQDDDKDSDEESFHLPIDDDEPDTSDLSSTFDRADPKSSEIPGPEAAVTTTATDTINETEDEILDKFATSSSPPPLISIFASRTEEELLLTEEEKKKPEETIDVNGIEEKEETSVVADNIEPAIEKKQEDQEDVKEKEENGDQDKVTEAINGDVEKESAAQEDESEKSKDGERAETAEKTDEATNSEVKNKEEETEKLPEQPAVVENGESADIQTEDGSKIVEDPDPEEKREEAKSDPVEQSDQPDKCENSNDSSKTQNYDSEDLMDISQIRDADEDNAENAYNEAHQEESEDCDDRNSEKDNEDASNDKLEHIEEDTESDRVKTDDLDIDENSFRVDCDVSKDAESDNNASANCSKSDKDKKTEGKVREEDDEVLLDEFTGQLRSGDVSRSNSVDGSEDGVFSKPKEIDSKDGERKTSKRTHSEEPEEEDEESAAPKRCRSEDLAPEEVEKPTEKLPPAPLRSLVSFSEYMKTRRLKKLTMQDLEEYAMQKICEAIVHKSETGLMHQQLKQQEQLIETMRKEIQQLTKQARDLEIVNKKLVSDFRQHSAANPKPFAPLKITRSVGLQVKFNQGYEGVVKRRTGGATLQKVQLAVKTANRTANGATPNRQVVNNAQKQVQLTKPTTPILSQALQTRRVVSNSSSPTTPIRTKGATGSVIDLTDEDDKAAKKVGVNIQNRMVQKTGMVQRATPVRTLTTGPQSIRLTTSQGKTSSITSVVTSSAPQIMYVVQPTNQSGLSTLGGGSKAVVVNFQPTSGVLTSTLNGSAVSVIPKVSNTLQLKTVPASKALQAQKIIKPLNKHPAPLPAPPVVRVNLDKPAKPIPPKPHLTIRKMDTGIILQWKMPYDLDMYEVIASYQLYAYQETSAMPSTDMWRRVGDVKALALPMACTLTQFADKNKYYFAVRAVDIHKRIGAFSEPEEISL